MKKVKALQFAQLGAVSIDNNIEKYVELINANINPPTPITASQIYIRAMYIVSDAINSYGGRFDRIDLPAIAKLFIDSPVLIGHDKSGLPVARNFWAETVEKGGRFWIKSYFYWRKDTANAEQLKLNIDSGIYKECSVSFVYGVPECSACGGDIRSCGHQLGGEVFFYYREIEKVLETSFVYRGSIPDTSLTDQLSFTQTDDKNQNGIFTLAPIHHLLNCPNLSSQLEGFNVRINGDNYLLARKRG
jgi:hypothetical protein